MKIFFGVEISTGEGGGSVIRSPDGPGGRGPEVVDKKLTHNNDNNNNARCSVIASIARRQPVPI